MPYNGSVSDDDELAAFIFATLRKGPDARKLKSTVSGLKNAETSVTAEAAARAAADSAEASARAAADNTLGAADTTEASTRAAADVALDGRLDVFEALDAGTDDASSVLTLSTTKQDVPGCTRTRTFNSGEMLAVVGIFDIDMGLTTNYGYGLFMFNSVQQTNEATLYKEAGTVAQVWMVTSPGTGSKTFKLRGFSGGSSAGVMGTNTKMLWLVLRA